MSLYDNEENAIVNNNNDVSETPSNLVNNNLGLETSQEELDKKLQYKRDGNVNESKLSPNPAGFGFVKQLFVTPENTATNGEPNLPGEPNVLYLVQVINDGVLIGFRKYKWTPSDGFVQFGATPDLKLKDGPRETPTRVENEPKRTPARVFDGDVAVIGDLFVKGQKVQGSADPLTPSQVVDIVNEGIEGGDINVVANPTLAGTESPLTGLQIGDNKYAVGGSSTHCYVIYMGDSGTYPKNVYYFTDNDNITDFNSLVNDLYEKGFKEDPNNPKRYYCASVPFVSNSTASFRLVWITGFASNSNKTAIRLYYSYYDVNKTVADNTISLSGGSSDYSVTHVVIRQKLY